MRIRILGCSGGNGAGSRTSAMLVDNDVLLDAGTGVGDLAIEELHSIRHVFLTHAHLDHIAGLPMLIDSNFEERILRQVIAAVPDKNIRMLSRGTVITV
jgi:ribonuclease BN (tRNA processing enzyme)